MNPSGYHPSVVHDAREHKVLLGITGSDDPNAVSLVVSDCFLEPWRSVSKDRKSFGVEILQDSIKNFD